MLALCAAAAGAQPLRFEISRIVFEGNTVVTTPELEALARPYENRPVTIPELKGLTRAIKALYQKRGYLLARAAIPPQKLRPGGQVRVHVSEGRFGRVEVEGNRHYATRFIRRFFGRAMRGGLVEEARTQRSLILMGELPDLSVRSLFLPGSEPGTSDVSLRVHDRQPFHFGVDYNNFGSPLVGRNRAGLALWTGNLLAQGDELTARYTELFPSESDPLLQAGYSIPVGTDGNRVTYSFARAVTAVSGDLAELDIRGAAEIHALTWQRPLVRELARAVNVSGGLVFKTVENFVLGTTRVSKDDLRMLTFGLDTNVVADRTRTLASVQMTQGLGEWFAGNPQGDAESSRAGSGNEFARWNVELFHVRDLGRGRFFIGRFSGQVASDPMAVSEQFALGGPDSVRGYIQSDFLGDNGYTTALEYRENLYTSPNRKLNVQGAVFLDHGDANLRRPQLGEVEQRSFTGAGAGLRAGIGRTSSVRVDVGFPLTDRNSLDDDPILYAQTVSRW